MDYLTRFGLNIAFQVFLFAGVVILVMYIVDAIQKEQRKRGWR